jgi:hypothetical protein
MPKEERAMLSSILRRVEDPTPSHVTIAIRRATQRRVARCAAAGRKSVERRIFELDYEWDVERVVQAACGGASLAGLLLGAVTRKRRWLVLPPLAAAVLLQQAIRGWSPPVALLRRLGIRTAAEIDFERSALRAAMRPASNDSKTDWVETASGHIKRASQA